VNRCEGAERLHRMDGRRQTLWTTLGTESYLIRDGSRSDPDNSNRDSTGNQFSN